MVRNIDFDVEECIQTLNSTLSKDGKGYVNPKSIEREYYKGNVKAWTIDGDKICAYSIMSRKGMLWNLLVLPEFRGRGIGSRILKNINPTKVRVKAIPIGHLSTAQREAFVDPTPFYLKNGYKVVVWDHARNTLTTKKSKEKSILIMHREDQPDATDIAEWF